MTAQVKLLQLPESGGLGSSVSHPSDWGVTGKAVGDLVELPLLLFLEDIRVDAICIYSPSTYLCGLSALYMLNCNTKKASILPSPSFFNDAELSPGIKYMAYKFVEAVCEQRHHSTLNIRTFLGTNDIPEPVECARVVMEHYQQEVSPNLNDDLQVSQQETFPLRGSIPLPILTPSRTETRPQLSKEGNCSPAAKQEAVQVPLQNVTIDIEVCTYLYQ
jgi:hypothetical protein